MRRRRTYRLFSLTGRSPVTSRRRLDYLFEFQVRAVSIRQAYWLVANEVWASAPREVGIVWGLLANREAGIYTRLSSPASRPSEGP